MMRIFALFATFTALVTLAACRPAEPEPQSTTWLEGSTQEQLDQLADQFGGFSQTMIEVGYRYNELHFAAQDRNWPLAAYHADKIEAAIRAGIQRRPDRGPNAERFLDFDFRPLQEAIRTENPQLLADRIDMLPGYCNACHAMEDVGFIRITPPERRILPWETPEYLLPE